MDAAGDIGGDIAKDYAAVKSVNRVCALLNVLQESSAGATLAELADAAGVPRPTAFRYLRTLEEHRYVERLPSDGRLFTLGLGFLGMQSRQLDVLRLRARPWLEKLRDQYGETINLGMLDGDSVIYLEIVESRRGVRLAARRGDRDPIHSTALGKAIAADLPEGRVREILQDTDMSSRTPNTITTVDDYLADLAKVRRIGFAVDNAENEIDGRCVAVAIPAIQLPAAISLSAPSARFPVQEVEDVAVSLREAAEQLMTAPAPLADDQLA